jgi:hypothetical protein
MISDHEEDCAQSNPGGQGKQPYEKPIVSRHLITHAEKDRLIAEQNNKSKAAGRNE